MAGDYCPLCKHEGWGGCTCTEKDWGKVMRRMKKETSERKTKMKANKPDDLIIRHGKAAAALQYAYDLITLGRHRAAKNALAKAVGYQNHQSDLVRWETKRKDGEA